MEMNATREVISVFGDAKANKKLAEGWKLLAVIPGERKRSVDTAVVYVFGRRAGINVAAPGDAQAACADS